MRHKRYRGEVFWDRPRMLAYFWPARCYSLIFHTTLQCYRENFVRGLPGGRNTATSASKTISKYQGAGMRVLR
ncbi:hypothetical protein HBI56_176430 [Parastagonospora nodorum]|nr:hypothetical protein HBH56_237570 [Parastagonospora nodorum]KAH3924227.1 hypothetical protein HBH54_197790 [Parastagonospora nodorum]KAH3942541.1 hypothetical protein HBH53_185700 [Parastagonospora nodorum]KAH3961712.1 hypothetical protein HBH51_180940 [Parastagonospora nodorum]KAH3968347.1 hypothetical protein HBH52_180230 [Parastagonospora nodorum]